MIRSRQGKLSVKVGGVLDSTSEIDGIYMEHLANCHGGHTEEQPVIFPVNITCPFYWINSNAPEIGFVDRNAPEKLAPCRACHTEVCEIDMLFLAMTNAWSEKDSRFVTSVLRYCRSCVNTDERGNYVISSGGEQ